MTFWTGFEKRAFTFKVKNAPWVGAAGLGLGSAGVGGLSGGLESLFESPSYENYRDGYLEKHPKAEEAEIKKSYIKTSIAVSGVLGGIMGGIMGMNMRMAARQQYGAGADEMHFGFGQHSSGRSQGGGFRSSSGAMGRSSKADLLKELGVPDSVSTKAEITRAYRDKARQHHPDKGGDPEKMKRLNDAMEKIRESSWFSKLAFLWKIADVDSSGRGHGGVGKGTVDRPESAPSKAETQSGSDEDLRGSRELLDRERNPRDFGPSNLGPTLEAPDGSHVFY